MKEAEQTDVGSFQMKDMALRLELQENSGWSVLLECSRRITFECNRPLRSAYRILHLFKGVGRDV